MIKSKSQILFGAILLGLTSTAFCIDVNQFDNLKETKISTKQNQKMLVVEAKGDPNIMGGQAFGLLFQLYYRLNETPKPLKDFPRARWPQSLQDPKVEWTGLYALPVPETVTQLPPHQDPNGLKASLETWEYGQVAEILYLGSYKTEQPTLERLKKFVIDQGYTIIGGHEEEYIKGPETGENPENYVTILRYRVKKLGNK
jgi:hypothetical protein